MLKNCVSEHLRKSYFPLLLLPQLLQKSTLTLEYIFEILPHGSTAWAECSQFLAVLFSLCGGGTAGLGSFILLASGGAARLVVFSEL